MITRLIYWLILATTIATAKPTTQQLVDKVIRDAASFYHNDGKDETIKSLRSGKHRGIALTLLRQKIEAASDYDLEKALKAHWFVFGEKSTTPILLKAAKRHPTSALSTLSNIYIKGTKSKALRQWIVSSLQSEDPAVRYYAVGVSGNHGPESVQPLIEILENPILPDSWERRDIDYLIQKTLERMEENGSPKFIRPLLGLMDRSQTAARAVETLMTLQESWDAASKKKIIEHLHLLLNRPYVPGRQAAATALAKLGIPAGTGFLLDGMDMETRFKEIDRSRCFNSLLPLMDENPVADDAAPWEIDYPKIAKDLKKVFKAKGWPISDTRALPTELSPADEKTFRTLSEGGHKPQSADESLITKIDQILSAPPDFERKGDNRSPEFLDMAASCFQANDRRRAAQMLDLARQWSGDDEHLIRDAFTSHVEATIEKAITHFIASDDRKALEELRKLQGVALDILKSESERGKILLEDLVRREKLGTLDRKSPVVPQDFDALAVEQRVQFLIDSFDTIFVHQSGYPGGVDFSEDPRVAKLIEIGDGAVPSLIDCIEKDRRLTRSIQRWRSHTSASLLGVREPALLVLMSTLRVQAFDFGSTSDNFTSRGEAKAKQLAEELRDYWRKFGHMSLDERMMVVLQDPDSKPDQLYEAAWNLSTLGAVEIIGTTFGTGGIKKDSKWDNPAVSKFESPTAAEAILTAMDRAIIHHREALEPRDEFEIKRFANCLGNLGDSRIEPELRRRWSSAPDSGRAWPFVIAAKRCDRSALFDQVAAAFAGGTLKLKVGGEAVSLPDTSTLSPLIESFIQFDDPTSKKALAALADAKHPFFPSVVTGIGREEDGHSQKEWTRHPFWYPVALAALNDERTSGLEFWLDKEGFIRSDDETGDGIRDWLKELSPKVGRKVPERLQDLAANAITARVPGLPKYHLLCPDRPERLQRIQFLTSAWADRIKEPNYDWREAVGFFFYGHHLIPALTALESPATEADVAQGRATFAIKNSQVADLGIPLPARAKLGDGESAESVVVFQAERSETGKILCGILGRSRFESVPFSALKDLRTIGEKEDTDSEDQ